jgi:hypothetical protein
LNQLHTFCTTVFYGGRARFVLGNVRDKIGKVFVCIPQKGCSLSGHVRTEAVGISDPDCWDLKRAGRFQITIDCIRHHAAKVSWDPMSVVKQQRRINCGWVRAVRITADKRATPSRQVARDT